MANQRKLAKLGMRILSFDIEEWFHILDHDSINKVTKWNNFESRIRNNLDKILNILIESNTSATFFIIGWIGLKYPEIVKRIQECGYEIGSHSHMHQLAYNQSVDDFTDDLRKSINTLEDITGQKIKYYRAPGFSITERNSWALEVLIENGIEIDCSIFPASRAHGGMPSYGSARPTIIDFKGIQIKELPINTYPFFGNSLIFSGGGYFRILPYPFLKYLTKRSDYLMSYFHPRDFDFNQPKIEDLSPLRTFKSYVGLKSAERKFKKWITDFSFLDIKEADSRIDWGSVEIVSV
jgi:polysaccharide deacetylase family protein (PEP-CTERM system associated)